MPFLPDENDDRGMALPQMPATARLALVMEFYEQHCGLLPLEHRFIVIHLEGTTWSIPCATVVDLTTDYYERHGWYEPSEIEEGEIQLHGQELRDCIEVNGDLVANIKDVTWSQIEAAATLVAGPRVIPPHNDKLWWFEEQQGGSVEEMTDLEMPQQVPLRLLWFDDDWAAAHNALHLIPHNR